MLNHVKLQNYIQKCRYWARNVGATRKCKRSRPVRNTMYYRNHTLFTGKLSLGEAMVDRWANYLLMKSRRRSIYGNGQQINHFYFSAVELPKIRPIIMRPSYRPRLRVLPVRFACPSVRLSVRLSRNSKTKRRRKIKIGTDVSHSTSEVQCQFSVRKVIGQGHRT